MITGGVTLSTEWGGTVMLSSGPTLGHHTLTLQWQQLDNWMVGHLRFIRLSGNVRIGVEKFPDRVSSSTYTV